MARRLIVATVALAALLLPAGAWAGGFATVGLSSLPDGTSPGEPWHVELTVLQHGHTPMDGLEPKVEIARGADTHVFLAKPAGKTGVYAADVTFPSAGQWSYTIDDGFTQRHPMGSVQIGPAVAGAAADGPDWRAAGAAALGAGLVVALAVAFLLRRREGGVPAAARG
jgi:hypothetical protein